MSFQPEKIRTLFSPSAHVQTAPFAPVPFPLSVTSVDSCKKIQGPSTLNSQPSTILECYAWGENVTPGKCRKPLILLICYDVTTRKAIFGGVRGGRCLPRFQTLNPQPSTLN